MDKFSGWLKKFLLYGSDLSFFDNPPVDSIVHWFSMFFTFALMIFLLYVLVKLFHLWYKRRSINVENKNLKVRIEYLESVIEMYQKKLKDKEEKEK